MRPAIGEDPLVGLRVCLVTPGHPSTNPRLVKEADALHAAGCVVRVVHGDFLPWARRADMTFANRPWRTQTVPFGPHAARATWLRQGIAMRTARLATAMRLPPRARWMCDGFHPAVRDLARAAIAEPADVFLGHNLAGLIAAAHAAKRDAAMLGFDAEDDHVGELPDLPRHAGERSRRETIQRSLLPRCAHRTASSPRIASSLGAHYSLDFVSILNVFPLSDLELSAEPTQVPASPDSIYWVSQTIGPGRGLEAMIDALALMQRPPTLVLRGLPRPGFVYSLHARILRAGNSAVVLRIEPPLAPEAITASCRGHAIGLSLELVDCDNHRDCLGNKIFHYLLAGTPVLLSDTPAQRDLAASLGPAALCVDLADAALLAARLQAWLADTPGRTTATMHAQRLARGRYCWDVERSLFLDTLRRAVHAHRERAA